MRISRLIPSFDHRKLDEKHDFYRISIPEEEGAWLGAYSPFFSAFSEEAEGGSLEGVVQTSGKVAWVMTSHQLGSKSEVRDAAKLIGADTTIYKSRAGSIDDRTLLRLLLSSLSRTRFSNYPSSCVGGHLVLGLPKSLQKKDSPFVVGIEVDVDSHMGLSLRVRTFSSLRLAKHLDGPDWRTPLSKLPRYLRADSGFFVPLRGGKAKKSETYVPRVPKWRQKSTVPSLDLSGIDGYRNSKLGILCEVIDRLECRYGDVLSLTFEEIADADALPQRSSTSPSARAAWRKGVAASFGDSTITIWDCAGCDTDVIDNLASGIERRFSVPTKVGGLRRVGLVERVPCIRIINDKEFYELQNADDPHADAIPGFVIQHLTVGHLADILDMSPHETNPILDGCVKELAVKLDVALGKARLFKVPSCVAGFWVFGVVDQEELEKTDGTRGVVPEKSESTMNVFSFVTIDGAGNLEFESHRGINEVPAQLERLAFSLVADREPGGYPVEYAVMGPDGDVNAVFRTELFSLPDFREIEEQLKGGNTSLRGNDARAEYMAGISGISFSSVSDEVGYYRTGLAGPGMRQKLPHATILREVRVEEGSKLLFPEALEFLDVDYVRLGILAARPFPLKYLDERRRELDRYKAFRG